jgi:hypothetical protein
LRFVITEAVRTVSTTVNQTICGVSTLGTARLASLTCGSFVESEVVSAIRAEAACFISQYTSGIQSHLDRGIAELDLV